jgi:transglutaminase-like putative cysteine protease
MIITTLHETVWEYATPVTNTFSETRLRPISDSTQTLKQFSLSVDPLRPITAGTDYFGNTIHTFNVLAPHRCVVVTSHSVVETHRDPFAQQEPLSEFDLRRAHVDYLGFDGPVERVPQVVNLACEVGLIQTMAQSQTMGTMTQSQTMFTDHFAAAQKLNAAIHELFQFEACVTDVHTPISDVFELGKGVCQDFAHIFIAACRTAGLPARYVSGYLVTRHSRSAEGAFASHAWCEVLLPGVGWIAFDPTNNLMADDYYIKLAVGRDYRDVPPTRGLFRGVGVQSTLRVRVHTAVHEEGAAVELRPELVG